MARQYPRVTSVNLVSATETDPEKLQGHGHLGATINISEGGILFESKYPFPLLATVKISIVLKDQILEVSGKVVRLEELAPEKISVAVKFQEVEPGHQKLIKEFVIHRREEDYE